MKQIRLNIVKKHYFFGPNAVLDSLTTFSSVHVSLMIDTDSCPGVVNGQPFRKIPLPTYLCFLPKYLMTVAIFSSVERHLWRRSTLLLTASRAFSSLLAASSMTYWTRLTKLSLLSWRTSSGRWFFGGLWGLPGNAQKYNTVNKNARIKGSIVEGMG